MRLFVYDMLVNVNVIYYVHVCEQARWARSAGNSATENLCNIIIIDKAESCIHSSNSKQVGVLHPVNRYSYIRAIKQQTWGVVYSATIFNHFTHHVTKYRLLLADCNNT